MRAGIKEWEALHPDVAMSMAARPLSAFNDQPLREVAGDYDLLFLDHPMIGSAVEQGQLTALDQLLPHSMLRSLAADAMGSSHESYSWGGHQWATAVDAACQVSVWQDERLNTLRVAPPGTWPEVISLARDTSAVALPLYPSDTYLSLLSITATRHPDAAQPAECIGEDDIALLRELVALVDATYFDCNPPALLDLMSSSERHAPAYCPLTFGYSIYQRPGHAAHRLTFGDVPRHTLEAGRSMLGGAGLAVSATAVHPREAAQFAAWAAGADAQLRVVVPNGGQPASRTAWLDPAADEASGGFFGATRRALERARLRPRDAGWPAYQHQAGLRLVELLRQQATERQILRALTTLRNSTRKDQSS